MDEIAIAVRGVGKRYDLFESERARISHALWPRPRPAGAQVWALQDVTFDVRRGESVAVIGRNGGGKSTLLQILTGTLQPTLGEVTVRGRVSALLELGSGFNPEYTGRDNVILNGLLLGMQREQVLRRFDEIAAFADIGAALERPVKTYSSGMLMRLAFAVQVAVDPEILIIDEALSVGDFFFQQKCFRYILGLRERGVTLLFVSHDMGAVRDLCTTGLFLKAGRVDFHGDNLEAIRRYLQTGDQGDAAPAPPAIAADLPPATTPPAIDHPVWRRTPQAPGAPRPKGEILAVGVSDASGAPAQAVRIGSAVVFRILFRSHCDEPLHVNLVLKNRYDQVVTATGSYTLKTPLPELAPDDEAVYEIRVQPLVEAGHYSFTASLAQPDANGGSGTIVDETPLLGPIQVTWDYAGEVPPFYGMFGLPASGRFMVGQDA
jgi:lipopolysaccharide transport system ATP-binding protein